MSEYTHEYSHGFKRYIIRKDGEYMCSTRQVDDCVAVIDECTQLDMANATLQAENEALRQRVAELEALNSRLQSELNVHRKY